VQRAALAAIDIKAMEHDITSSSRKNQRRRYLTSILTVYLLIAASF
jgi:hypothetical protein